MSTGSVARWIVAALLAGAGVLRLPSACAGGPHAASYDLDVRIVPAESRLEGRARIRLRDAGSPADTVRFWLHGELRVSEVRAHGRELAVHQETEPYGWDYSLVGNHVSIGLPGGVVPAEIDVEWAGFLHPSDARSPSDYMRIDESGVFLRALGYSPWFPLLLEPDEDAHSVDFTRVCIEVPSELTAVFAGVASGRQDAGSTARYEWRADNLSLFDAQLTARPFRVREDGDVRVYALDSEESVASGRRIADFSRFLLGYYARHYAKDAVSAQIHIVEMPRYGDIASGNVVGIQEESWRAFEESDWPKRTLAHELVHAFVRLPFSRTDPLYALVVEGFPSFYHYAALAECGAVDYGCTLAAVRESYLEKRRTGVDRRGRRLPDEKPISRIAADEIGRYKDAFVLSDRALLFLEELRTRMGPDGFAAFNRALFAGDVTDDASFRALVCERVPDFEAELSVWLDTIDLPRALSD